MPLKAIENKLPWGLHDSYLERIEMDFLSGKVRVHLRLQMDQYQTMDQRGILELTGVVYFVVEPPAEANGEFPSFSEEAGLWLDVMYPEDYGHPVLRPLPVLPPCPEGCFAAALLVRDWEFTRIFLCARAVQWIWTEDSPRPSRSGGGGVGFPGDTIELNEEGSVSG